MQSVNASAKKSYKFSARIEAGDGGGAYVLFPFDVVQEFGARGRVPVRASLDGVQYTGTMIKYGHPQHMLPVLKAIREQIGKAPGDLVEVEIQLDESERTLEIPAEFEKRMREHNVLEVFAHLSFTHRREYCRWITAAKREETRSRRLAKAVEMLRDGVKTPG